MDRLREIEAFVAVAETGSFNGAAQRLRVSPPAVTRLIASLEERIGARVLARTTLHLSLTEICARYLEHARNLIAAYRAAIDEAAADLAAPSGHLRITAPASFGRKVVAPIVSAFLKKEPAVSVSLLLFDRVVDLVEEGIDLACRIGYLPNSSLTARRLGTVDRLLVASPDYLTRRGAPSEPKDLSTHDIVAFTGLMPNGEWLYRISGQLKTRPLRAQFETNDSLVALEAVRRGEGITLALSYMVRDDLAAGRLVPVLAAFTESLVPVSLVHASGRLAAPKIRAFIDFAAPRLRAALVSTPTV